MDIYAIKTAMNEVRIQLDSAHIDEDLPKTTLVDFAFKMLMLDEIKQLNKNLERLNDYNSQYRR